MDDLSPVRDRLAQLVQERDMASVITYVEAMNRNKIHKGDLFTLDDYLEMGRAISRVHPKLSDAWDAIKDMIPSDMFACKIGVLDQAIKDGKLEDTITQAGPEYARSSFFSFIETAIRLADTAKFTPKVMNAARDVQTHLKWRMGDDGAVIKTTPVIDELNRIITADDHSAMHKMVIAALYNEREFTHLDYLALGRSRVVYDGGREAWLHANMSWRKIDQKSHLSLTIGTIAARVERNNFTDPNLSLRDQFPKEFDRTKDFLATTHTASRHHPDPNVRRMAAWAEGHLEQRHAQQWGLMPKPE